MSHFLRKLSPCNQVSVPILVISCMQPAIINVKVFLSPEGPTEQSLEMEFQPDLGSLQGKNIISRFQLFYTQLYTLWDPRASYYKKFFIHRARANLRPLLLTKSSHICSKKWSRICRSSMLPIVKLYREFPDLPTPISSLQIVSD